jgi:hypothetical protein
LSDFYYAPSQQNPSASNIGANGETNAVSFAGLEAGTLLATRFTVLSGLAGPSSGVFD